MKSIVIVMDIGVSIRTLTEGKLVLGGAHGLNFLMCSCIYTVYMYLCDIESLG